MVIFQCQWSVVICPGCETQVSGHGAHAAQCDGGYVHQSGEEITKTLIQFYTGTGWIWPRLGQIGNKWDKSGTF